MTFNEAQAAIKLSRNDSTENEAATRLTGRRLLLARAVWLIFALFAFVLLVASLPQIPALFAQLQTPCIGASCADTGYQLSPASLHTLATFGVSPLMFAIFAIATYSLLPALVWIVVGIILVWHKSDDWMALLVSFLLIMWGVNFATVVGINSPHSPVWQSAYLLFAMLVQALFFLFFGLFPNGRFVPRWTIAVALIGIVDAPFTVSDLLPSINWLFSGPVLTAILAAMLVAQIYRYVRVSTRLQRQQTKWLLYGVSIVFLISNLGYAILNHIFPALAVPGSLGNVFYGGILWAILFLCIPISIGFAMLRYRLWDIDIIINRTLVYGSLTGILGALYAGLVIGLESLIGTITGQSADQPIALVISTLIIAALFQPARKRIQTIIDHRFYRKKYDAHKTLAAFSATLREEVDLGQLQENLLAVVEETMQPEHVSLWVRPDQSDEKRENSLSRFP